MKQEALIVLLRFELGGIFPRGVLLSVLMDCLKERGHKRLTEKAVMKALEEMKEEGYAEIFKRSQEPGAKKVPWVRSTASGVMEVKGCGSKKTH